MWEKKKAEEFTELTGKGGDAIFVRQAVFALRGRRTCRSI